MDKVEKIKAEIERLINKYNEILSKVDKNSEDWVDSESMLAAKRDSLICILSFIDSLPDTEKDFGIKESVIPFGASDSELMEATYFIPQGYHAIIDDDKVIIKKGEEPVSEDLEEEIEKIWLEQSYLNYDKLQHVSTLTYYEFKDFAKHFAQWQKEREQSTIELAEDHAYLAGQEKIIDKACDWLLKNDSYAKPTEVLVRDFKKAMEDKL